MRLLDLFCGAGGAGMGYHRAGFDVVGVDINPQPHYPFEFHQADALEYLAAHGHEFDAIHASPPCQAYSTATRDASLHPDMYVRTRVLLESIGKPWAIENVPGAPYLSGGILCGSMFSLKVRRHRNFETSFPVLFPDCAHGDERPYTITGSLSNTEQDYPHSLKPSRTDAIAFMGMSWATWQEVVQVIPPDYTEYIGGFLMTHLEAMR